MNNQFSKSIFFIVALAFLQAQSLGAMENNKNTDEVLTIEPSTCFHYGLYHWFKAFPEFLSRGLLCGNEICGNEKENKRYTTKFSARGEVQHLAVTTGQENFELNTDCFLIACCDHLEFFDNPIGCVVCAPLAALTHLACLPFACFQSNDKTDCCSFYAFRELESKPEIGLRKVVSFKPKAEI